MTSRPSTPDPAPQQDAARRVSAAVFNVDGLSLLVPLRAQALRWSGRDAALAVILAQDLVEVRLVARRLPLPPLLDQLATALRAALTGTGWEHSSLRLVVAELSAAAFTRS